ncbi:MAG TPA: M48 family metalloprotease [Myxococcota bacterium]|jgi:predicted Zn-dependent protease|nr:M48 family metalloprotease [Myxococcota bacterium]
MALLRRVRPPAAAALVVLLLASGGSVGGCFGLPHRAAERPESEPSPDEPQPVPLPPAAGAPVERPAPRKPLILQSEVDDRRAGREAEKEAASQLGLLPNKEIQKLVSAVGQRLVRYAPPRPFDYEFQVDDSWPPNAFALPGGFVFLSRGTVVLSNSEDELAGVLAHEITHVAARHAAARQQVQRSNPFAIGFMGAVWLAAYARDQEREADRGGQEMAAAAGYDPVGLASFLRSLDGVDRLMTGTPDRPTFLDTHPGSIERNAVALTRAQTMHFTPKPGITKGRDDYLKHLVGLVAGDDPAQGVFVGSRFLHPDLDFGVSFPDGWTLVNEPAAVSAISPSRDARISVEFAAEGEDARGAAERFIATEARGLGVHVDEAKPVVIDGRPAYEVRGQVPTAAGTVSGLLTFIPHQGKVYRISLAALSATAPKYLGRARSAARSFRSLTPAEREQIEVEAIDVVAAKPGETLAELSRRTDNVWELPRLAVLNGVSTSERFGDARLVKIVTKRPYEAQAAKQPL